jgi:hypothetical protein
MENEDYGYEYDEGSDIDNWEDEQVFQDTLIDKAEQDDLPSDAFEDWRDGRLGFYCERPEPEFREDFGYFGEMGLWD